MGILNSVSSVSVDAREVVNFSNTLSRDNEVKANSTAIGASRQRIGLRQAPARLYSVGALGGSNVGGYADPKYVMIHLPSIPPELSFERNAQFNAVPTMVTPDGAAHVYQHTEPMQINYEFDLHYLDEYCVNGAVDLIRIGGMLHALTLPFRFGATPSTYPTADNATDNELLQKANARTAKVYNVFGQTFTVEEPPPQQEIAWPPPCVLDVMYASARGVRLYGYVKRASVIYKEPWLQVGDSKTAYNLPSAAKYSFTFVHAPTYRNLVQAGGSISSDATAKRTAEEAAKIAYADSTSMVFGQAYTEHVRDHFYDAVDLARYQELTQSIGIKGLEKGNL